MASLDKTLSKGTDQADQMRRLVCAFAFVVHKPVDRFSLAEAQLLSMGSAP